MNGWIPKSCLSLFNMSPLYSSDVFNFLIFFFKFPLKIFKIRNSIEKYRYSIVKYPGSKKRKNFAILLRNSLFNSEKSRLSKIVRFSL